MSDTREVLLVYIPCWVNYKKAALQARALRLQYQNNPFIVSNLQLRVVISMNAVPTLSSNDQSELKKWSDNLYIIKQLTGDININLGFYEALRTEAHYLWLLSPEDMVSEEALTTIVSKLKKEAHRDFLVANEESRSTKELKLKAETFSFEQLSNGSFGMISGVVYRLVRFRESLHLGLQGSFTHWGQLAVLLGSLERNRSLTGLMIFSEELYFRGDTKDVNNEAFSRNIMNYSGSFFGMPLLMHLMTPSSKPQLARWVRRNFLKIGMYRDAYFRADFPALQRLINLPWTVEKLIKAESLVAWIYFRIACSLDFLFLRKLKRLMTRES